MKVAIGMRAHHVIKSNQKKIKTEHDLECGEMLMNFDLKE